MSKKVIAVLLAVVLCLGIVLSGCGNKAVTEEDLERISTYYFDKKFEGEHYTWERVDDTVVTAKEAYVTLAKADSGIEYSIAILKDGSGVYSYGIATGKANRLGGCNVGY